MYRPEGFPRVLPCECVISMSYGRLGKNSYSLSPQYMLRASGVVGPDGALLARVDAFAADDATETAWIDWVAVQFCGFCSPSGSRPRWPGHPAGGARHDDATALVDEASASEAAEYCVVASEPQVLGVGLALRHGQPHCYCVRAQLPPTAPPSFEGAAVCCEYVLIITLRTTSPPTRSLFGWVRGRSSDWVRGPLRQLRLPLHVQCSAKWVRMRHARGVAADARLRCALHCAETECADPGTHWPESAEQTRDLDSDNDDDDDEESGDDGGSDSSGDTGGDGEGAVASACAPAQLRVDGDTFACVQLLGSVWCVGGAVRGVLSWPSATLRCSRVLIQLQLEEHADGAASDSNTGTSIGPEAGTGRVAAAATTTAGGGQCGRGPDTSSDYDRKNAAPPAEPSAAAPSQPPLSVVVAGRAELGSTGGAPLRRASFEVAVPAWLPPTSHLHAADTVGVDLHWALRFTFDVSLRGTPANRPPQHLPWAVPLQVLAAARPGAMARARRLSTARVENVASQTTEAPGDGRAIAQPSLCERTSPAAGVSVGAQNQSKPQTLNLLHASPAGGVSVGAQTPPPSTVEMRLDEDASQ